MTETSHLLHFVGLLGTQRLHLLGGRLQLRLAAEQLLPQMPLPLLHARLRGQTILL